MPDNPQDFHIDGGYQPGYFGMYWDPAAGHGDDSFGIQDAINAAASAGEDLYIQGGNYRLFVPLDVKTSIRAVGNLNLEFDLAWEHYCLRLSGEYLKDGVVLDSVNIFVSDSGHHVENVIVSTAHEEFDPPFLDIRNCDWDGNGHSVNGVRTLFCRLNLDNVHLHGFINAIDFRGNARSTASVTNSHVDNCRGGSRFTGLGDGGLYIGNTHFEGVPHLVTYHGIELSGCSSVIIENSTVSNFTGAAFTAHGGSCISLSGGAFGSGSGSEAVAVALSDTFAVDLYGTIIAQGAIGLDDISIYGAAHHLGVPRSDLIRLSGDGFLAFTPEDLGISFGNAIFNPAVIPDRIAIDGVEGHVNIIKFSPKFNDGYGPLIWDAAIQEVDYMRFLSLGASGAYMNINNYTTQNAGEHEISFDVPLGGGWIPSLEATNLIVSALMHQQFTKDRCSGLPDLSPKMTVTRFNAAGTAVAVSEAAFFTHAHCYWMDLSTGPVFKNPPTFLRASVPGGSVVAGDFLRISFRVNGVSNVGPTSHIMDTRIDNFTIRSCRDNITLPDFYWGEASAHLGRIEPESWPILTASDLSGLPRTTDPSGMWSERTPVAIALNSDVSVGQPLGWLWTGDWVDDGDVSNWSPLEDIVAYP